MFHGEQCGSCVGVYDLAAVGSSGHGACCEAHMNFADESACLTGDNVRNEGNFLPLRIYVSLQMKPCFIRNECELRFDITFDDRL
jgi:hypothetical protein